MRLIRMLLPSFWMMIVLAVKPKNINTIPGGCRPVEGRTQSEPSRKAELRPADGNSLPHRVAVYGPSPHASIIIIIIIIITHASKAAQPNHGPSVIILGAIEQIEPPDSGPWLDPS